MNYRELDALNSSMIRLFDTDPVKFFEQFKLGKKKKDKKTPSLIIGDIVDFYLLDCNGDAEEFESRFDEKFALYNDTKGTGQVFILADILFDITKQCTNEKDEITTSFITRFKEAYQKVQALGKYSGKSESKVLEDFNENGLTYFETLVENSNKIVVELSLLERSRHIGETLLTDGFTEKIFKCKEEEECFYKFPIEWEYTTSSGKVIKCKSELDILKIDHNRKEIYPKDLKTTYDNESFELSYMKNQYYLQGGFYYLAVKHWARQEGMGDYNVLPMEFVVADTSSNNRRPIRYQLSREDMSNCLEGFYLRGNHHKGVIQIIEEISWAEDNNIWNCSKELYTKNGILQLDIKYE